MPGEDRRRAAAVVTWDAADPVRGNNPYRRRDLVMDLDGIAVLLLSVVAVHVGRRTKSANQDALTLHLRARLRRKIPLVVAGMSEVGDHHRAIGLQYAQYLPECACSRPSAFPML